MKVGCIFSIKMEFLFIVIDEDTNNGDIKNGKWFFLSLLPQKSIKHTKV